MPPVVPNAILNSGNQLEFYDDTEWVGGMYKLHDGIWDSAQEVTRNQFKIAKDNDVMIFSFYPTKPIGGCDGGMVVSNNRYIIENYRTMVNNGCTIGSSWNIEQKRVGYKMHGNSIQALIAYNNFKNLDQKNKILNEIRAEYNDKLNCANTSLHLYKIRVDNNKEFLQEMKYKGIQCGIHYGACHNNPIFRNRHKSGALPKSELEEKQTISIPFHENLTNKDVDKVIKNVKKLRKI
jgi:dTDP-4-amino-4,6-dideoxygalactose transaminase